MRTFLNLLFFFIFLSDIAAQATPLTTSINTGLSESYPLLSPDGQTLYFVRYGDFRNMGTANKADIWMANKNEKGTWKLPVNATSPLNTLAEDAVLSVGPAAAWLMHYSPGHAAAPVVVFQEGRSWKRSEELQVEGVDDWTKIHTCFLDLQGQVLFLVKKGQNGDLDLFYAEPSTKGQWYAPKPLILNSSFDDHYPVLAADGKTLYFASNRPGGSGDFDWWMSRKGTSWEDWSTPENIGPSFNTPNADTLLTISASGEETIVGRQDENGQQDLYTISMPEEFRPLPIQLICGECRDEEHQPMEATLIYQTGSSSGGFQKVKVGANGSFCLVIPQQQSVYISAEKPGFLGQSLIIDPKQHPEELDTDPGAAQAWARLNTTYFQRDQIIEEIRLRLQETEQDFLSLQAQHQYQLTSLKQADRMEAWRFDKEDWVASNWDSLRLHYKIAIADTTVELPSSYDWISKGTMDEQQEQKRRENRTELQANKNRFRQYLKLEKAGQEDPELQQLVQSSTWNAEWTIDDFYQKINIDLNKVLLPEVVAELASDWSSQQEQKPIAETIVENVVGDLVTSLLTNQQVEHISFSFDWQEDLEVAIFDDIEHVVFERMKTSLSVDIFEMLDVNKRRFEAKEAMDLLEEELRKKVSLQIQEEEKNGFRKRVDVPLIQQVSDSTITLQQDVFDAEITLNALKPGELLVLDNLFFKANSLVFHEAALLELSRLVQFFDANSNVIAEFRVHNSTDLSHLMAMDLSNQRARKIVETLAGMGANRAQFSYRGYGKIAPVNNETGTAAQLKNQRVELLILEVKN